MESAGGVGEQCPGTPEVFSQCSEEIEGSPCFPVALC